MIWVPVAKKAETGKPEEKFFICGTVFDVSQTDPIDSSSESEMVIIIEENLPQNNQPINSSINIPIKSSPSLSLRNQAEKLTEKIEHLRRPMTQNPTPKRMREFKSRLHDADNMERTQKAMIALADLHDNGACPQNLASISRRSEIEPLVYKSTLGGGYYEVIPDPNYRDISPIGNELQELIGSIKSGFDIHKTTFIENDFRGVPGFFPTPKELAEKMVSVASIYGGMKILEPSAGSGRIANAIKSHTIDSDLLCIELNYDLVKHLQKTGFNCRQFDFLDFTADDKFDRIIMNPPFENGSDIKHIKHAINFLKPEGKLVAICANGPRQHNELL